MFKKASLLFLLPLYLFAAPLSNISPIDTGFVWEYEFYYMWGGHFLENGHQYNHMNSRRIITVDSMKILPGNEAPDSTIYFLTVNDSGLAFITTDSSGSTVFDTVFFDTVSSIKDSVIYTEDTVITFCEIFLQNYKTDSDSFSVYSKDAMDTMYSNIFFEPDSLDCYIEQYEQFDGQQYDKREFYFVENCGALYLYNISSFFCAVQEYYYNLVSFNGNPVIDTTDLFDQIGKYATSLVKNDKIKNSTLNIKNINDIQIFNLQGKLLYRDKKYDKNTISKKLPSGSYLLISNGDSNLKIKEKIFIR